MRKEVAATIRRAASLALKQHSMRRQLEAGALDSTADTRGAEVKDVGAQLALGLNTQAVSTE